MATLTAADGTELHLHDDTFEGARAVCAFVHGYGEHSGRYNHLVKALWAKQIGLIRIDLRGHGRSKGTRGLVMRFNDYHLDVTCVVDAARKRAKGAPVFLLAHSMGALASLDWLLAGGGKDLAGLIMTSPFMGIAIEVGVAKATLGKLASRVMPQLALPSGLEGKLVSRDPEMIRLYDSDPLMNKAATARWFTEAVAAHGRVLSRAGELKIPSLLLYGSDDKLVSVPATEKLAAAMSMKDKTVERVAGGYHELVNEPLEVRGPIMEKIAGWILARVPAAAPAG